MVAQLNYVFVALWLDVTQGYANYVGGSAGYTSHRTYGLVVLGM